MISFGSVFGFPLQVDPTALFIILLFVLRGLDNSPQAAAFGVLYALMMFASILVHELGHALAARYFRLFPIEITLHALGGYTRHAPNRSPWQGILVTLAGPVAGLVLGVVFVGMLFLPNPYLVEFAQRGATFNIFWSIFNLLPMFPMDGGLILMYGLSLKLRQQTALVWAARVGVVMAALVGGWALMNGEYFLFIIVIFMLMRSVPAAFGNQ
jgi:stage IV sporulation protein FB